MNDTELPREASGPGRRSSTVRCARPSPGGTRTHRDSRPPGGGLRISPRFAAIDFETADYGADSACALAVVAVGGREVLHRRSWLLRPPRRAFRFTHLHGISWADVAGQPTFREAWPEIRESLAGAEFLAAHNARFDRGVLSACCGAAGIAPPPTPFLCTVRLARSAWGIHPTKLPDVCRGLGIPLRHHEALSDAEACARIVMAAIERGHPLQADAPLPGGRAARAG